MSAVVKLVCKSTTFAFTFMAPVALFVRTQGGCPLWVVAPRPLCPHGCHIM